MARADSETETRMVVVAGKGGVGRTTVAAALAVQLAREGRRVLLAQTRARERLGRLLGGPPAVDDEIRLARERLWIVNMTPEAALREYGLMVLRSERVYHVVLENRYVAAFLRGIPGLDEYSMLGKVWWHTTERDAAGAPRFDVVVLDGPATGHLLSMLRLPRVILDAVPPGPLTRDAARCWALLRDPARTRIHLVTLAEEMPVAETIDLAAALRDELGLPLGLLIENRLLPDRLDPGTPGGLLLDALAGVPDEPCAGAARHGERLRRRRALETGHLARLEAALPLPRVRLPRWIDGDLDAAAIERLADAIAAQAPGPDRT